MTRAYTAIPSPAGKLLLSADDQGLKTITFNGDPLEGWIEDPAPLRQTIAQLEAYFAGELTDFTVPLALEGTPFQLRVWNELLEIPYGQTISYGQLAHRIGNPNASRAVGLANGSNPIPIIVPCHRVIGSSGKLTGYGGGLPVKERLLTLERGLRSLL